MNRNNSLTKKTVLFHSILMLVSTIIYAQQTFIPHNLTHGARSHWVELLDLDGDNYLDIISFSFSESAVLWYRNDGYGYFDTIFEITSDIHKVMVAFPIDFDFDGDIDVLTGEIDGVYLYKNQGNGSFANPVKVNSVPMKLYSRVYAIDLDNDTLIDVLSASTLDNTIGWSRNLGNNTFDTFQVIDTIPSWAWSITSADLNNDGKMDIIYNSSPTSSFTTIAWRENLGNGNFGLEQVLDTSSTWNYSVRTADLNNDSRPDVITSYSSINLNGVKWLQNLGNGNFSSGLALNTSLKQPKCFATQDLDGDGLLDILMTSWSNDSIGWQQNLGNGNFSPFHLLSSEVDGAHGIGAGDIDNDGDIDIVASAENNSDLVVIEDLGHNIYELKQRINYSTLFVTNLFYEDLNNDGLTDVVSASMGDHQISWHQNHGNKQFNLPQLIANHVNVASSVQAADLNNDGTPEVIAGGWPDTISWSQNLSGGTFDTWEPLIDGIGNTRTLRAKDLDLDNRIDIIGNVGDQIRWAKNMGNGIFAAMQVLYEAQTLTTFDFALINNDSLPDIVYGNQGFLCVGINLGNGLFATPDTINPTDGIRDIQLSDMDNDGDIDILYMNRIPFTTDPYHVGWYPNDGFGNFDTLIFLANLDYSSWCVNASDIDLDGDMDIFVSQNGPINTSGNLLWFENLGQNTYSLAQHADYIGGQIKDMHFVDLDMDNDEDLILAIQNQNHVKWLENTLNNVVDTLLKCPDDSIQIQSNWIIDPGLYETDSQINSIGGDSINFVLVENYPTQFTIDTVEICEGDFYDFNGQILTESGDYTASLQSIHGCDSLVDLPLIVHPTPVVSIDEFNPDSVSMLGGVHPLPNAQPAGGTYSGTGVTAQGFDPSVAGPGEFWVSYSFTDAVTNCVGSDSSLIKVYDPLSLIELSESSVRIYPNPGTGWFTIEGINLQLLEIYTLSGQFIRKIEGKHQSSIVFRMDEEEKGTYFLRIIHSEGESMRLLILE